jgi:hypothetical protein
MGKMQVQRPGQHCTFVVYQPSLSNDLHDEVSSKLTERVRPSRDR